VTEALQRLEPLLLAMRRHAEIHRTVTKSASFKSSTAQAKALLLGEPI
jgi:hypothetical protein